LCQEEQITFAWQNGKLTWRVLMTQTFGKPRNDFETPEKERSKEKALRSSDLLNEAATRQKKQK